LLLSVAKSALRLNDILSATATLPNSEWITQVTVRFPAAKPVCRNAMGTERHASADRLPGRRIVS
jgi:hypothetical protein